MSYQAGIEASRIGVIAVKAVIADPKLDKTKLTSTTNRSRIHEDCLCLVTHTHTRSIEVLHEIASKRLLP